MPLRSSAPASSPKRPLYPPRDPRPQTLAPPGLPYRRPRPAPLGARATASGALSGPPPLDSWRPGRSPAPCPGRPRQTPRLGAPARAPPAPSRGWPPPCCSACTPRSPGRCWKTPASWKAASWPSPCASRRIPDARRGCSSCPRRRRRARAACAAWVLLRGRRPSPWPLAGTASPTWPAPDAPCAAPILSPRAPPLLPPGAPPRAARAPPRHPLGVPPGIPAAGRGLGLHPPRQPRGADLRPPP